MRWMERLDLTPEQTNSIQAIRDRYQPQIDSVRERMQQRRDTMHSVMGSNASEAEIRQQRQQMMQLRDEMSELRFNSMMEIREVLTEEQRAQVREWMEERRGEWGRDRGNRVNVVPWGNALSRTHRWPGKLTNCPQNPLGSP